MLQDFISEFITKLHFWDFEAFHFILLDVNHQNYSSNQHHIEHDLYSINVISKEVTKIQVLPRRRSD